MFDIIVSEDVWNRFLSAKRIDFIGGGPYTRIDGWLIGWTNKLPLDSIITHREYQKYISNRYKGYT